MTLFLTGFLQVFCVSVQTWFLSRSFYLGVAVFGFLISFIWSFNIKAIAFGGPIDQIIYSLGASAGAVTGLWVGKRLWK